MSRSSTRPKPFEKGDPFHGTQIPTGPLPYPSTLKYRRKIASCSGTRPHIGDIGLALKTVSLPSVSITNPLRTTLWFALKNTSRLSQYAIFGMGMEWNQTPYYEEVTQLFYANLVFNEDGMSATSYMFGRNIKLSRV